MSNYKYAALFVRNDSAYKKRKNWDCYDIDRDARNYAGSLPAVCHPPCRLWGVLAHMASAARPDEKELAIYSINVVRKVGGIIEHPSASKLFKKHLPDAGMFPDEYGGFTILIDQYDFGHVANKGTKLYICGLDQEQLPSFPKPSGKKAEYSMTGQVPNTKRCTQYQREYTPEKLMDYFESVLNVIRLNKGM